MSLMTQTCSTKNKMTRFQKIVLAIYALIFLWGSSELLYFIVSIRSIAIGNDSFYDYIYFTQKPIVMGFNILFAFCWFLHIYISCCFTQTIGKIDPLISRIADIIVLLLLWPILYYIAWLIPLGNAMTRTDIVTSAQSLSMKMALLPFIFSLFWCGISAAFLFLQQINIQVRRPRALIRVTAILWLLNAGYVLFYV